MFDIYLQKLPEDPTFGVKVSRGVMGLTEHILIVEQVGKGGMAGKWNAAHPDLAVKPLDRMLTNHTPTKRSTSARPK